MNNFAWVEKMHSMISGASQAHAVLKILTIVDTTVKSTYTVKPCMQPETAWYFHQDCL